MDKENKIVPMPPQAPTQEQQQAPMPNAQPSELEMRARQEGRVIGDE